MIIRGVPRKRIPVDMVSVLSTRGNSGAEGRTSLSLLRGDLRLLGGSWVVISGVISPLAKFKLNLGYNYSYPTYNPTYIYP